MYKIKISDENQTLRDRATWGDIDPDALYSSRIKAQDIAERILGELMSYPEADRLPEPSYEIEKAKK